MSLRPEPDGPDSLAGHDEAEIESSSRQNLARVRAGEGSVRRVEVFWSNVAHATPNGFDGSNKAASSASSRLFGVGAHQS
jgi:hypothetical protein